MNGIALISDAPPPLKKAKTETPVASIFAKAVKKEPEVVVPSKSKQPSNSPEKKLPKKADTNGSSKPLASIFAKPVKKEVKEDDDDEHIPHDDEEGEDEISDEELEEQEEKAAVKLASIFTKDYKSVPVADKGWKEGEA